MKSIRYFLGIICIGFIFVSPSCKDDDSSGDTSSSKANELNVSLDGQPWTGSILSWAVSGGTRQINANASDGSMMQVFMPVDTTGYFEPSDNTITVSYNDGNTTWSNNVSGWVNITANSDDHVEGEFEMVIGSYFNSDTLSFTSGTFYFKDL